MTNFVIGIIFLTVTIVILATASDLLRQWYANYLEKQKKYTAPYEDNGNSEISKRPDVALVTSIHTLTSIFHTYKTEQHRHERQRAFREKIIIIVGIAAASFAGWSAIIFQGQLTAVREQLTAMRSEQRPWIKITDISPKTMFLRTKDDISVFLNYTASNVGRSPAINFKVRGVIILIWYSGNSGIKIGKDNSIMNTPGNPGGNVETDNLSKLICNAAFSKDHELELPANIAGPIIFPADNESDFVYVHNPAKGIYIDPIPRSRSYAPSIQLCARYFTADGESHTTREQIGIYRRDDSGSETTIDPQVEGIIPKEMVVRVEHRYAD